MTTLGELWRRLVFLLRGDSAARDLEDEVKLHVALRAERYEESGMAAGDASLAAQRRFGSPLRVVERSRDAWIAHWLDIALHDLRYAARGLRRSPLFTLTVVITLTLGLGLNAAIYSLLDRLFVQSPSGVANPGSVRRVYASGRFGATDTLFSDKYNYPELLDLQAAARDASVPIGTYATDSAAFGDTPDAPFIATAYTDSGYWSVLGVHPAIGRVFTNEETKIEVPGSVAVVSDAFRRRELGGDASVIGRTLRIGGRPYTVVGVASPAFTGVDVGTVDIWLPLGAMPIEEYGDQRFWYQIRGRSRLHVLTRAAPTDAPVLDARLAQRFRTGQIAGGYTRGGTAKVVTGSIKLAAGPVAESKETVVATRLAWVSLLVLLVAYASVANLLLTRLVERRREIAVRLALGASRRRVAVRLLIESLLLGGVSVLSALVAGAWASTALQRMLMPGTHWGAGWPLFEWHVVLGTAAVAMVATVAVGLTPIGQLRHLSGDDTLRGGSRTTPHAARVCRALVVLQTMLAVVLLAGAALFVQSLRHVEHIDVGYAVDRVLFAQPALLGDRGGESQSHESGVRVGAALAEAAERLSGAPGVAGIALAWHSPMDGYNSIVMAIPGRDSTPMLDGNAPADNAVSPEYWSVVGMRVAQGRLTNRGDIAGAAPVIVVNETMARVVWPGQSAVGQCIQLYKPASACRTVVGVVRDAHLGAIVEKPRMMFYTPLAQASTSGGAVAPRTIILRTFGPPQRAFEALRTTLNRALPFAKLGISEMHQLLAPQLRPWRIGAVLFTVLSVLALTIAAVGLYGVIAYGVRSRARELGIRLAVGAPRELVARLVVGEAVRTVAVGVAAGSLLAALTVRFVGSLLYKTSLTDPTVLVIVGGVMLATAVIASMLPAWRAARADPVVALRSE